jgi:plastocyanin
MLAAEIDQKSAREDAVSRVARGGGGPLAGAVAVRAALGGVGVLILVLTFAAVASAQAVVVDFSYDPAAPTAGEPVTFTSTSSLERPIVLEAWDFNDDGQIDAFGHSVTRTFDSAGTYSVVLHVLGDTGMVRSASKLVTVSPGLSAPSAPPAPPPPRPVVVEPSSPPPTSHPSPIPQPPTAPVPPPTTGSSAPMAIAPFPVVRIAGSYTTLGVRLRLFAVTAPAGVWITVRCQGRGCPYRRRGPFVVRGSGTRPVGGGGRYVRIRGFPGHLLKPGVRLQVFVAHEDRIGKYTSFRIRRGHPPLRADRCLRPGGTSVISCG